VKLKSSIALAAVIALCASAVATAQTSTGFEAEPVFRAGNLVSADLLKGPHFAVDDRVPVAGLLEQFTIRSDYDTFEAHGRRMLRVRTGEIDGLVRLNGISSTAEFTQAATRAVARPVASAANMVANPVETVESLPGGLTRLFDRVKLGGNELVAAATAPDSDNASAVTQRVGSITVDALGFEKERRDLAKSVGVDPYTTNAVLARKLTDMAWVAFSGRFTVQAAMSVFVPGSTVISAVTITNTTIYDTPPGDLINRAQSIFVATGAPDAQVQALIRNQQYSLSVLTVLAHGVQRLQGASGLGSIVGFAAAAKTQDETRMVAGAVNMLARYHETVRPIARVAAPGPIAGYTTAGGLVVTLPVDYVAWTERVARWAQRDDLRAPERIGWISGQFSSRARMEFEKRGWRLMESYTDAAER